MVPLLFSPPVSVVPYNTSPSRVIEHVSGTVEADLEDSTQAVALRVGRRRGPEQHAGRGNVSERAQRFGAVVDGLAGAAGPADAEGIEQGFAGGRHRIGLFIAGAGRRSHRQP